MKNQHPKSNSARKLRFESLESRQLLAITFVDADADTYIRDSTARGNFAVLDTMDWNGSGDWTSYVRFDLSGVDIDTITDATLFLYKVPGTQNAFDTPDRFDVYGLTNDAGNTPQNWDESTLSLNNVGSEYSSANGVNAAQVFNLDSESGADTYEHVGNTTYTAKKLSGPDLVAFLNDRVDDNGLVTFVTRIDAGNVRGWGYASKEHPETTMHPLLKIQHSTETPESDPFPTNPVSLPRQMENLDRGLIATVGSGGVTHISWRLLGTDPSNIGFNLYRQSYNFSGTPIGGPTLLNTSGTITNTTDWTESTPGTESHEYYVLSVIDGVEQGTAPISADIPDYAKVPLFPGTGSYFELPISAPPPINGNPYEANDASVGDLDGDGEYEIILKWVAAEAPMYLDAYKLDGTQMWRISLGQNISASFTGFPDAMSFSVYDLDGDGKAEVAMNTAPGAVDGLGAYVLEPGDDPFIDYVNGSGYQDGGPEYFSIFDGETGALLENIDLEPARGTFEDWGDNYGHRATTFLQTIAYLDGQRPSVVIGRGIYHAIGNGAGSPVETAKTELVAYNWRDGQLTEEWTFTAIEGTATNNQDPRFVGQGNHNLSVGDVDGDGFDEIIWAAMVVDHDGTGLISTDVGHGDAIHFGDLDPSNPGLEVFKPNEGPGEYGDAGGLLYDALTGEKLVKIDSTNDVGRGAAFDIDPNHDGYEVWATTNVGVRSVYNVDGTALYPVNNISFNFGVWWDADPLRELLDGTTISKWQYDAPTPFAQSIFSPGSVSSNNGTKATPSLSGDILGDWREEVILRKSDNTALRIFHTPVAATSRMWTLMHDSQYRQAIAWQNDYYNQPPHPSFFLGAGMSAPEAPNIYLAGASFDPADLNQDGFVDGLDLGIMLGNWGQSTTPDQGELDGTPPIDGLDLGILLGAWNPPAELYAANSNVSAAKTSEALEAEELSQDLAILSLAAVPLLDSPAVILDSESEEAISQNTELDTSYAKDDNRFSLKPSSSFVKKKSAKSLDYQHKETNAFEYAFERLGYHWSRFHW